MTEQWARWEPISGLAEKYDIVTVSEEIEGFRVVLFDEQDSTKKAIISFEQAVSAYRSTDESFRYKLIRDLDERYGSDFYGKWTFFKLTNSLYLEWLLDQSEGVFDPKSYIHFSIITSDSILDIVASYEPKVELIG